MGSCTPVVLVRAQLCASTLLPFAWSRAWSLASTHGSIAMCRARSQGHQVRHSPPTFLRLGEPCLLGVGAMGVQTERHTIEPDAAGIHAANRQACRLGNPYPPHTHERTQHTQAQYRSTDPGGGNVALFRGATLTGLVPALPNGPAVGGAAACERGRHRGPCASVCVEVSVARRSTHPMHASAHTAVRCIKAC